MSTLLKTIEDFRAHVTVNFNFTFDLVLPYVKKAERKHIKRILGPTLYSSWTATAPLTEPQKEVFGLLQEASANLAMLDASKIMAVQVSDAGIFVSTNSNATPAGWAEKRDMRRQLLQTGMEAIDEALEIMEENEADFTGWSTSQGYTHFKELFIRKTQDFQRYFNIENSRLTFLRLRPHLLKVEDKFFNALLGTETASKIKAAATDEAKAALKLAQAAQAHLAISEIANSGAFLFTPNGLFVATTEIPGEKHSQLPEQELHKLHLSEQQDGIEYLKKLKDHLLEHDTIFTEYAAKEAASLPENVHNTKSTVSF